jgi:hypothetical protein
MKTLTGKQRQELKAKLWRLDDDVAMLAAEVSRRIGEAWKSAVEREDYLKHLNHAHNAARDLLNRIELTMRDLT